MGLANDPKTVPYLMKPSFKRLRSNGQMRINSKIGNEQIFSEALVDFILTQTIRYLKSGNETAQNHYDHKNLDSMTVELKIYSKNNRKNFWAIENF